MSIKILLTSALLSKGLFEPNIPLKKKISVLKPYFSPPIGDIATLDKYEYQNSKNGDFLALRGFIKVTPPKNRCFIVRKSLDERDRLVCKPEVINFQFADLDKGGRVNWIVYTGKNDFGTPISWPTPHRIAQYIPLGGLNRRPIHMPILSCKVSKKKDERKITLTLINKIEWNIYFPAKDILTEQPLPTPNLHFVTLKDGRVLSNEELAAGQGKKQTGYGSLFSKRKSRIIAEREWAIHAKGAFEMSSSKVNSDGGPSGIQGLCRYKLKGAENDPESGVIECKRLDSYEAIYTHISCAKNLPRSL